MFSREENANRPEQEPEEMPEAGSGEPARPEDEPAEEQPPEASKMGFPIVGIGASAGGLAALEKFFANMPATTEHDMAFVVVQHLDPDHKSILVELIKRYTTMQVVEVKDGMEVQPNHVYIIPPNKDMAFMHGRLHLMEPMAARGLRLPIDFFFRSLAQDQHERAICVVLSGTGTDGTLGLKEIKGQGGMTMVQDPASADYDGMPRSAIATGMVDYVLPPEEMPARLIAYVEHAFGKRMPTIPPPPEKATDSLQKIFILLRNETGHDFSYYKQATIGRRIERRMAVNQIDRLEEYVRYLQQNPLEVQALFRELLIGVTSFFRDPEAFETLKALALIPLLSERDVAQALRIWVPGCSTGEEAYSIAILAQEAMDDLKRQVKVQIFATDIDAEAIDRARTGVYPDSIAADVSPERLARFFHQEDNTYHIRKSIRDMVVFATQNVIEDPPFSRLDLISCRNLLIYMGSELQKKVISLFHYALNPGGYLFLGNSETVGEYVDLFEMVDRKWKLFRRKGGPSPRPLVDFGLQAALDLRAPLPVHGGVRPERELSVRELAEKILLQEYTPACAIINDKADVLYIHGRTGRYLEPPPGEASLNIIRMAREGLRLELTTAIRKVLAQKTAVRYPGLRVKTNGEVATVDLLVKPVLEPPSMRGLMLVIFQEVTSREEAEVVEARPTPETDKDQRIAELERELQAKEQYLQTTIEELETANEELKSTNEELQSSNEELQSTNEELETSKEELQSVNEELTTVNTELQQKIDELTRTNNDMNNLLAGTGVGTIFVDNHLIIKRFTPAASQVINLIHSDIGRPVGHIASNLTDYDHLVQDIQGVLDTLAPKEVEVQTTDGRWYLVRILPYRTLENVIEGAVITFVDITETKRMQEQLRELSHLAQAERDRLRVLLDSIADEVWFCDAEGNLFDANTAALRGLGFQSVDEIRQPLPEFLSRLEIYTSDGRPRPVEDAPLLRALRGETVEDVEEVMIHPQTGERLIRQVSAAPVKNDDGEILGAVAIVHDLTARRRAEEGLRRLAAVVRDASDAITVLDLEGRILAWNPAAERLYGWSEAEALEMNIRDMVSKGRRKEALALIKRVAGGEKVASFETQRLTKDGRVVDVLLTATALVDEAGKPYAVATTERVV